jgi:hypothetical protein
MRSLQGNTVYILRQARDKLATYAGRPAEWAKQDPETALDAIDASTRVATGPLSKEAVGMALRFAALGAGWSASRRETARQFLREARGSRSYWYEVLEDALTLASADPDDTVTLRDGRVLSHLGR